MSNQIVITSGAKLRDLDDVIVATDGILSSLAFNVANGVPRLDENGKILVSQLPNSVMEFKGVWNAATNTPTLANGTGSAGDVWLCNVAGTVNFGAGPIAFAVGDYAVYTGTVWARSSGATGTVTSVGVSRDGNALAITGSPVTTSGVINLGFSGDNTQYINGAGNLTTFPTLTGYVPYTGATTNVNIGNHSFIADNGTYNTEMSPSYFGVQNNAETIFSLLEYNKLTLTDNSGLGSVMEINALGLVFPDASVQTSAAIDSLNGLNTQVQYFETGTSGTDFNIVSSIDTHTFNIPSASATARGLITTGTQTIAGAKTFNGGVTFASSLTTTSNLTFSNSGYTLVLQPPTLSVNRTVTLPNGTGTLALTSDISYPVTSVFGRTGAVVAVSGDYNTDQVTEGTTNLYFTNARSRAAISLTTTGSSGASTYNNSTGVLNIPNYGSALSGYVPYTGATQDVDLDTHVLNAQALHVKGTAGAGHLGLKHQSASPTDSANESLIFADVNGNLGWLNGNLYLNKFITSANTANRSYTFPNASGTIALTSDLTGGTVTSVALSAPTGFSVSGSPVTTSGTLALAFATGYSLPTNVKQSNWDDAYTWVAAFPTQTGNTGKFLTTDGSSLSWAANPLGTVTSVAMTVPTGLSIAGSPITTSGTLAVTFASGYSIPTNASQTNWDTAYTNRITSLTVTGSSGASTLISNVLNIPTYTLSGLGGVPTSRTLTINGVTYDLSADRTWTITAGISSVSGTAPISVSTVSGAATVSISQATTSTNGYLSSTDFNIFNNKVSSQWVTSGSDIYYNTGNVGIGITPTSKLHLYNNTAATELNLIIENNTTNYNSQINFKSKYGASIAQSYLVGSNVNVGNGSFEVYDSTAALTRFVITSNGNVMIGNTTAYTKFSVNGNSQFGAQTLQTSGTDSIFIGQNSSVGPADGNSLSINVQHAAASANPTIYLGYQFRQNDNSGANLYGSMIRSRKISGSNATYTSFETSSTIGSGTEKMRLDDNGTLALNTTSYAFSMGSLGKGLISSVSGDFFPVIRLQRVSGSSKTDTDWEFIVGSTGSLVIGNTNDAYEPIIIEKQTSATNPIYIKNNGLFYINTTSGVSGGGALQVNGNVNINGLFQINGTTIGGGGGSGVTGSGTTNYGAKWTGSTSLGNTIMYENGNNIGFGTTTPQVLSGTYRTLDVRGTGGAGVVFGKTDGTVLAYLYEDAGGLNIQTNNTQPIMFIPNGSEVARITGDGNFLIGTTTNAGYKFEVRPSTYNRLVSYFSGAYISGLKFSDLNGGISYNAGIDELSLFASLTSGTIVFNINSSTKMKLFANGRTTIGNSTDYGYTLNVAGDLYVTGSAVYAGGVTYSGTQTFNNLVYLNSTTYAAVGQSITWKGSSGTTYDFSISNSGTVPYILSSAEIDLNAPIGMRYGLIYTFKGNGSSAYNVNILNSGVAADELQFLGGLKLTTTTCGFVVPRMTTTQKNALSASVKVAGCIVYDTTSNLLQAYNGSTWNNLW